MNKVITADKGKVFRRISDQTIHSSVVYLGYIYYLHGELLDEPLLELPEHYEQIDDPELDEPILDEDTDMILEDVEETQPESKRVTLKDYLELEDKVNKLMEYIKSQD